MPSTITPACLHVVSAELNSNSAFPARTSRRLRRWTQTLAAAGLAFASAALSCAAPATTVAPSAASRLPAIALPAPEHYTTTADGKVLVLIHFSGEPAAVTFAKAKRSSTTGMGVRTASPAAIQRAAELTAARSAITTMRARANEHAALAARLRSSEFNARVLYTAQSAMNAIAVAIGPKELTKLSQLPGFVKVTAIHPAEMTAYSSVDFLGARALWAAPTLPVQGENIGVAVIDTGIDFVHKNFGGTGGSGYASGATATNGGTAATTFPTAKVVWGYDFAGDAYNANSASTSTPVPDANPMDTNGHGSSCASLIAGLGENADNTTYTGTYDGTAPAIAALKVPPGLAPQAKLYALKVFGTSGSTNLAGQALDVATAIYLWQAGGDANAPLPSAISSLSPAPVTLPLMPRLRVVSMSLGASNGVMDDDSVTAAQNAVDAGLVVLAAAGNNNDTSYIVSSPSIATGVISVAASFNDISPYGTFTAPASGSLGALNTTATFGAAATGITVISPSLPATDTVYANPHLADFTYGSAATATLEDANGVPVNNADGSFNSAASNPYLGKVVLIDRGIVSFHQKAIAGYRAGAAAVVIVDNQNGSTPPGLAATAGLPAVQIPVVSVTTAVGALLTSTGTANTGVVRPTLQTAMTVSNPAAGDRMTSYSSRGPRRGDSALKPDITAPAETVNVALTNTGTEFQTFNGTSSATPHVAGMAALLVEMHPDWTPPQIKAQLMNTATKDLFVNGPVAGGTKYGLGRIGAGRVNLTPDAPAVIAYASADPQAVSVNYGTIDVASVTSVDKTITVENKGTSAASYTLSVQTLFSQPGVTFSLPNDTAVTVPAGGTATITLRLSADPTAMRHARDQSMATNQSVGSGTLTTRQYLDEAGCYVVLTPTNGPTLRVPAFALPRRASTLSLTPTIVASYTTSSSTNLTFAGTGFVASGTTDTTTAASGIADITSWAKVLEWQGSYAAVDSPSSTFYAGDLRYVGIASDYAARTTPFDSTNGAVIVIGIVTYGNNDVPDDSAGGCYEVEFDTNNDGTADYTVFPRAVPDSNGYNTDVLATASVPANSSTATTTGYYTNILGNAWTNVYNNNTVLLAVKAPTVLGTSPSATRFKYRVSTGNNGTLVTTSGWLSYDLANPGVESRPNGTTEPFLTTGRSGDTVPLSINMTKLAANNSLGALAIYPTNGSGSRAQTISVVTPATLKVTGFTPTSGPVGSTMTVTGGGFAGTTQVTVGGVVASFTLVDDTTLQVIVPAGISAGTVRVVTPAGAASSRNRFIVTP